MTKVDPYLHAVLVLHGAGKEVSEAGIASVLKSAGVAPDEAKAKVLAEAVKGMNFEDLLKQSMMAPAAAAPAPEPAGPIAIPTGALAVTPNFSSSAFTRLESSRTLKPSTVSIISFAFFESSSFSSVILVTSSFFFIFYRVYRVHKFI